MGAMLFPNNSRVVFFAAFAFFAVKLVSVLRGKAFIVQELL